MLVWRVFDASWKPAAERTISCIALSETGRRLAAGTRQGRITFLDLPTGAILHQFDFPRGGLNEFQFSPDESDLAVAGRDLGLYCFERAHLRLLRNDGRNYGMVRFDANGVVVLVITGAGAMEIIDVQSHATRLRICCSTIYGEAAFSPDGTAIVGAGHWPAIRDANSGQLIGRLTANRQFETFRPIAFDAQCGNVFVGSQDGRVYAWNLEARRLLRSHRRITEYVDTLAITSASVAFAGFGRPLRLWNPQTGPERTFRDARTNE